MAIPQVPDNLGNLPKLREFLTALTASLAGIGGSVEADGSVPFTGDQSMGGHKLTNLAAPVAGTDAADKAYVDGLDVNDIKKNGSVAFTGDQSMGGHKLTNLAAPTAGTDAADKAYVDGAVAGAGGPFSQRQISRYTGGNFGVNTNGTFVTTPGPTPITIIHTGGDIEVHVNGVGGTTGSNPAAIGLGLQINGVEQAGSDLVLGGASLNLLGFGTQGAQGCGINAHGGSIGYVFSKTLIAGTYTLTLTAASSGFGGGAGTVAASAVSPLVMIVYYN